MLLNKLGMAGRYLMFVNSCVWVGEVAQVCTSQLFQLSAFRFVVIVFRSISGVTQQLHTCLVLKFFLVHLVSFVCQFYVHVSVPCVCVCVCIHRLPLFLSLSSVTPFVSLPPFLSPSFSLSVSPSPSLSLSSSPSLSLSLSLSLPLSIFLSQSLSLILSVVYCRDSLHYQSRI